MAPPAVRRADFLMALANATDLATGQSRDFALRSCVLAMRLAEAAGLDVDQRRNVYHQADLFLADAASLLEGIDGAVDRETILALEPVPHSVLDRRAARKPTWQSPTWST